MVDLKVYIVTFNCARTLIEPDVFGGHLFDGWADPGPGASKLPDVIVLTLQEVAPISSAFLGNNWVKPYFERFRRAIKVAVQRSSPVEADAEHNYLNVLARNSGLTALMIFAREDLVDEIQSLNVADVGVGLSEMANKGAIGARLGWKSGDGKPMSYTTFVSAHLAPFEAEVQRRDQDYKDIAERLVFTQEDAREWRKGQETAENVPLLANEAPELEDDETNLNGMYSSDTYLFFSGDLNYRTALTTPGREDWQLFPQPRKDANDPRHYSHLLEKDQLSQQVHDGKTLYGLVEQSIDFPPTYKYCVTPDRPALLDTDIDNWKWARHRWPSWCDRIFFNPKDVRAGRYSALPVFRTSDHRPVALALSLPLQQVSNLHLADSAPVKPDPHYSSRRDHARRKEVIVGIAAYLGLTWEGNSLLLGSIIMVFGVTYLMKAIS